jgi:hypothetical protein
VESESQAQGQAWVQRETPSLASSSPGRRHPAALGTLLRWLYTAALAPLVEVALPQLLLG